MTILQGPGFLVENITNMFTVTEIFLFHYKVTSLHLTIHLRYSYRSCHLEMPKKSQGWQKRLFNIHNYFKNLIEK